MKDDKTKIDINLGDIIQKTDPTNMSSTASEVTDDTDKDYRKKKPTHGTDADPYDPRRMDDTDYKTQFSLETALQVLKNKKKFVLYDEPDKKKDKDDKKDKDYKSSDLKSIKFLPEKRFFDMINALTEQQKKSDEELTPEQAQQLIAMQQAQEAEAQQVPQEQQVVEAPPQEMAIDPATGQPIDAAAQIDPATGQPIDPYAQMLPATAAEETGASFASDAVTVDQVGRVYELKRIYNKLISAEEYLSYSSDPIIVKLRKYVSQAVELFELVISNIDLYKDKIDQIIVDYYAFLMGIYHIMKIYYDRLRKEDVNEAKRTEKFMFDTYEFLIERWSMSDRSNSDERVVTLKPKHLSKKSRMKARIKSFKDKNDALDFSKQADLNKHTSGVEDVYNGIKATNAATRAVINQSKAQGISGTTWSSKKV